MMSEPEVTGPIVVATDRRKVTVQRGDMVILPPAVAVELSSSARWFGLVYTGPYPYHFRERFIQVWGFEHVVLGMPNAVDRSASHESGNAAATRPRDLRHRVYVNADRHEVSNRSHEFELTLTFDDAKPEGFAVSWHSPVAESVGTVEVATPDSKHEASSIRLSMPLEAVYLAHREARPAPIPHDTMSPEYRPRSSG